MTTLIERVTTTSLCTISAISDALAEHLHQHDRLEPAHPLRLQFSDMAAEATGHGLAAIALWSSLFGDAAIADSARRSQAERITADVVAARLAARSSQHA